MWRKEDEKPQGSAGVSAGSVHTATPSGAGHGSIGGVTTSGKAAACVSQGIKIKGEVTGSEDLFIDGLVDGKVSLGNATVTIGPNSTVKAEVSGREVIIRGRVEGKLTATERIQIWSTARVYGDVKAEKIAIEEGAELHGKMEAGKLPTHLSEGSTGFKKTDANKPKESNSGGEKTAPGAAVAGAN
jgi:cytoskeletal protein CcmA (bactofilin family)